MGQQVFCLTSTSSGLSLDFIHFLPPPKTTSFILSLKLPYDQQLQLRCANFIPSNVLITNVGKSRAVKTSTRSALAHRLCERRILYNAQKHSQTQMVQILLKGMPKNSLGGRKSGFLFSFCSNHSVVDKGTQGVMCRQKIPS